jgi:hypothetical protein
VTDYQYLLFTWASQQSGLTGLVILLAGFLYGFMGFKMFPALLVLTCGGCGALFSLLVAALADFPADLAVACGVIIGGASAFAWRRPATMAVAALTFGALGCYLGAQLGLPEWAVWTATGLCFTVGGLLALLCPRTMPVVMTVVQGAVLIVIGFVGLTTNAFPSFGYTFTAWAHSWRLLVPVLLTMVIVTAYAYQAMRQQGDVRTGS